MSRFKYKERIEYFMSGKMSISESNAFETELLSNVQLKEEYESFLAAEKVIDILGLGKQIELIKSSPAKKNPKFITKKIIRYAAAAFLIFMSSLFLYSNLNYSNKRLAEKMYNKNKPNLNQMRSNNETLDSTELNEAFKAYYKNDFDKTIAILNALSQIDSSNLDIQFVLGCSYFEINQPSLALNAFNNVTQSSKHDRNERSQWYIVLSYLSLNNIDAAGNMLEIIANDKDHNFNEEAIYLQNSLDSPFRILTF